MYLFSDFASVQALPDVVTVPQLSQAIGLSPSRTYEILDEAQINDLHSVWESSNKGSKLLGQLKRTKSHGLVLSI